MSQYAGSEAVAVAGSQYPHETPRASGAIHDEFTGLMETLSSLDSAVEVLSARLVHVLTPADNASMVGRIEDRKPVSPVADQVHHITGELDRIAARVNNLIVALEV